MSKDKRGQKVFTGIEAWNAHYLPGLAEIEREARVKNAIRERDLHNTGGMFGPLQLSGNHGL
jgi:hypothetical protein